jgi:hypothetical protein
VKGATESPDEFRKRLNQLALDEEEARPVGAAGHAWFLGARARNSGSLHSDTWSGTAADLGERGVIAVYPGTGWWKEQKKHDRSDFGARYAEERRNGRRHVRGLLNMLALDREGGASSRCSCASTASVMTSS